MSRMVISEIHSRLILVFVMASRLYRWQALETQLLSEEQKSVSSPAPKMSYFPCRQNREYCSAVPRVLPVLEVPDTPPSFSLSLPIPGKTIHYCLKISSTKKPTYSQHTKMNTIPTKRIKGQPDRHKWLGEQHISAPKCSSSGQTLPSKWQNRRQGKAKTKRHLFDSIGLQYLSVTVTI